MALIHTAWVLKENSISNWHTCLMRFLPPPGHPTLQVSNIETMKPHKIQFFISIAVKPKWSDYKSSSSSVLTSRKSSSTPSLPEATENPAKSSAASMEQAASTDNLAAKQVAEAIAEGVLSLARAEAISAVSGESQNVSAAANDSPLFVHHYGSSDLATIVETLTLDTQPPASGSTGSDAQSSTRHPETSSSKGPVASSGFLNKSFGQSRTNKVCF